MRSNSACWATLVASMIVTLTGLSLGETGLSGLASKGGAFAPSQQKTEGISLRRCLELAEQNFPKLREARAKRDQKRALVDVAKFTPFSEFSVTGGMLLAPTVSGTAEYSSSTDTSLTRNMGLAWQLGVEGALPLYTFGKITNGIEAAEYGARVGDHEIEKERNELQLNVRKAFYGVQLARDVRLLIEEAATQINKHLAKLKASVDEGDGDDLQLLKMQVFSADLKVRASEARKQEAVALSALRFLTGQGASLDVPDEPLKAENHELLPQSAYASQARLYRPELAMARNAVLARKSQVRFEVSKLFPDLGLGLTAKWSYAPEVTDQTNPFVIDNGNYRRLVAGLVLKYKLDFMPQSARISQAKAQYQEAVSVEQWATSGVSQQVTEAHAEARHAEEKLAATREAAGLAKQWLVKVQQGIEVGTMEEQDIVDPAKEFALKRFAEMQATFEYNIAFAKLAQTAGGRLPKSRN